MSIVEKGVGQAGANGHNGQNEDEMPQESTPQEGNAPATPGRKLSREEATQRLLQKNAELYRRLAQ